MSLINEALKKAQRQRTADPVVVLPAATGTAEAPVARIAKRRAPMPARTLVILIGGGVSLLLMGGLMIFLFWDSSSPAPAPDAPRNPVVIVNPQPDTPPTAVPPDSPLAPVAPVTMPPVAPVITVQLPPVVVPPPPAVIAPPPERPTPPRTPPATTPTVRIPTANPRVYQFLETLRISGIRVSETDPKVIMNDRVFRLNDLVDRATQLRLIRVDASSLTFADASGFEYQKNF